MKKHTQLFLALLVCFGLSLVWGYGQGSKDLKAEADTGPQIGQPAPDFELPWADQTGIHTAKNEWVKLSGLRGSNVILAFYVADWTGG